MPLGIAMPEAMVIGLAEADDGGFAASAPSSQIGELAGKVDAVVAGPGMTQGRCCRRHRRRPAREPSAALALDAALLHTL